MDTFYKLLQMLAIIIVAVAILLLLLALISPLKTKCFDLFSFATCRMVYICLASLFLAFVGSFTLRQLKKIVEGADKK